MRTVPPAGVNLMAFDSRFPRIRSTDSSCAITVGHDAGVSALNDTDRFLASSPKLDGAVNVWRVPVLLAYPIIGPVGQTGEILVNATSEEIISFTPLEEMKATARRLYEENRDAIEAGFRGRI